PAVLHPNWPYRAALPLGTGPADSLSRRSALGLSRTHRHRWPCRLPLDRGGALAGSQVSEPLCGYLGLCRAPPAAGLCGVHARAGAQPGDVRDELADALAAPMPRTAG